MKRLISFAAAAAMLFAAAPKTPSYAAETPAGASCVVYKVEKDHISIDGIGKDFRNGDLVIPEKIDGLPVTCIRENTFFHCEGLKTCVIPDSVEKIGNRAFFDCPDLVSVTIGNGASEIDSLSFSACPELTSVTIGKGAANISEYAFSSCPKLSSFTVSKDNQSYSSVNSCLCSKNVDTLVKYAGGSNAAVPWR